MKTPPPRQRHPPGDPAATKGDNAPPTSRGGSSRTGRILLGLAFAVALLTQLSLWNQVLQDDAYISFVYARNLARGEGLVYNPGEPPVEGYTNFLWTAAIAAGMRVGLDPEVVAQVLGMAAALGVVGLTFLTARRLGARPPFAAGAAVLLATNLAFSMEATGGLETPLFGLLLLLGILPRLRSAPRTPREDRNSALALALASLTRPEGVLVFVLLEAIDLAATLRAGSLPAEAPPGGLPLGRPSRRREAWRGAFRRAVPFVAIVGAHLVFRLFTYGDWVPNTFHAKVVGGMAAWDRGLDYVLHGAGAFGWVLLLLPLALLPWRRDERAPWVLAAVHLVYGAYVVLVGGDFKLTFRYLIPILPLWCALAADGWDALARLAVPRVARAGATIVAGTALTLLGGWGALRTYEDSLPWMGRKGRDEQLRAVGKHLHDTLPPGAWIAVSNAGIIPYFADRRTIDMLGLNDRHIASRPVEALSSEMAGHEKGDGDYVLSRRPDAILFIHLEVTHPATHPDIPGPLQAMPNWRRIAQAYAFGTSERQIAASPAFRDGYLPRSALLPGHLGWVNVFLRRDGP